MVAKLSTGASSQSNYFEWSTTITSSTVQAHYNRCYIYLEENPAASTRIFDARSAGALGASVSIKTDGKVEIRNSANSIIATSTNAVSLNQAVRLEIYVVHSATVGQVKVRIYNTATAAIASYTEELATSANLDTTAGAAKWRFGLVAAGSNQPSTGKSLRMWGCAAGGVDWFGPLSSATYPFEVATTDSLGEVLMICGGASPSLATGTHTRTQIITAAPTQAITVRGNGVSVPYFQFGNCTNIILDEVNLSSSGSSFEGCSGITIRNQTASVDTSAPIYELRSSANNITIEDSVLEGGTWCVKTNASTNSQTNWPSNLVIERCDISGATTDCIQINGLKSTMQDDGLYGSRFVENTIHDPVIDLTGVIHNDGIQCIGVNGLTITRNEFYCENASSLDGPNQGIILGHADPANATQKVSNVDVFSNLIHHWQGGSGITVSGTIDCRVANNTSVDNGSGNDYGFSISAKSDAANFDNTGLEVWNNIFEREQLVNSSSQPDYHNCNTIYPNGSSGVSLGASDTTDVDPELDSHYLPIGIAGVTRDGPLFDKNGVPLSDPPSRGAFSTPVAYQANSPDLTLDPE